MEKFTPHQIVQELDKYIIGQDKAKRSVAVALRNRYRRERLSPEIREEIIPKNILMMGPTGVGKTEIARRLARLAQAPFVKIEATKYTEVGYVGRDVESMIRDLIEISVRMIKNQKAKEVKEKAKEQAIERIIDILTKPKGGKKEKNPLSMLLGSIASPQQSPPPPPEIQTQIDSEREHLRQLIKEGKLDKQYIGIETEEAALPIVEVFSTGGMEEMGVNFQDMLGGLLPKKKRSSRVKISEAKKILTQEETQKLIDMEEIKIQAIKKAENDGIIFVDEMDKIAGRERGYGPDVSREGVQRDILPIIEGSTVNTKYGPVKTDHILFIAAGAFHATKPSDLIPELQGRFPIRVELDSLSKDDFKRILTEPANALTKQYQALLSTDNVKIEFTEDGLEEIARLAALVNEQTENIGARRLHTIMERLLEDLSYSAPFKEKKNVTVDKKYVLKSLADIVKDQDLSRYIL